MPQELLKGPLFLVVVGAVVLAAFMVKSLLGRLRLPPLVGYFAIGIVLFVISFAINSLAGRLVGVDGVRRSRGGML